ncbi:MAG: hypothetical protein ABL974_08125, partial [Prosthecobacter sp.]
ITGSLVTAESKTYPLPVAKFTYTTLNDTAVVVGGLLIKRTGVGVTNLTLTMSLVNATKVLSVVLSGNTGVFSAPGVTVNAVSTTGFRNLVLPVKTTADFAGKYTLAMPLAAAAATGTPGGSGYAAVTVSTAGLMTFTGKAGDGTTLTASLIPGPDRNYLLFLNPNLRAASYLAGKLNLTARPDSGFHIVPAVNGSDLQWAKAAKTTDVSYRNGIPNVGLRVSMEPWKTVPTVPAGQTLGSFLGMGIDKVFDFILTGDFNSAAHAARIPTKLGLTKLNTFRGAAGALGAAPSLTDKVWPTYFTLSVAPTTGLLTGTLKISDSVPSTIVGKPNVTVLRTLTFAGVMLQPPAGNTAPFAHGFFSIPPLNIKTETTTTSAFAFNGPVVTDPIITLNAGIAGTYSTRVRQLSILGVPSRAPLDNAIVTFTVSADLKTLTIGNRILPLAIDARPVELLYEISTIGDLQNVKLNFDYLSPQTLTGGTIIYNQSKGFSFNMASYDYPTAGTFVTKQ